MLYPAGLITKLEEEAKELQEKIRKLSIFLYSAQYESLNIAHKSLLYSQYRDMRNYYSYLKHRIELLKRDTLWEDFAIEGTQE